MKKHTKRCGGTLMLFRMVPVVEAPLSHGTVTVAREMRYLTCLACGTWLPLGPSDEEPSLIAIEIQAAGIARRAARDRFETEPRAAGWRGDEGVEPFVMLAMSYQEGYLARVIHDHDREHGDAP